MAEDAVHDSNSWLFIADFSIFTICAVCDTLLMIIWIRCVSRNNAKVTNVSTPTSTDNSGSPKSDNSSQSKNKQTTSVTIQQEMRSQSKQHTGYLYITLSILCALIFAYYNVSYNTFRLFNTLTASIIRNSCTLHVMAMIPYSLNRLFLYLYFIWRVKVSFDGTFLEMHQKHIKLLSVCAIISFTFSAIFIFAYVELTGCTQALNVVIAAAPFLLSDSIFAWLCLYLFASRLRKLTKVVQPNKENNSYEIREIQELKYISNKFSILSIFAVLFTNFIAVLYLIVPLGSLSSIDTVFNVICLMLSTGANDIYYKKLCVLCRMCCEKKQIQANNRKDVSVCNMEMVIH